MSAADYNGAVSTLDVPLNRDGKGGPCIHGLQ